MAKVTARPYSSAKVKASRNSSAKIKASEKTPKIRAKIHKAGKCK